MDYVSELQSIHAAGQSGTIAVGGSFGILARGRRALDRLPILPKVPMTKYLPITVCLLLLISNAAVAQHGGTVQEQRACASNVQRYCRQVLNEGDFAVLACLQQRREKLSAACKKV